MNDNTILTFGTHKGKALANIPDSWFIWMYDNGKLSGELKKYAEDNIRVLQIQAEQQKKKGTK